MFILNVTAYQIYLNKMRTSKASRQTLQRHPWLLLTLLLLHQCSQVMSQTNVIIDIDQNDGSYMVNSQSTYFFGIFTTSTTAGTKVKVVLPYQVTAIATSGSNIGVCKEAGFDAISQTYQWKTLTNCVYTEYVGYGAIEFTIGSSYTGITIYYFYIGYLRNPSSVIQPDSFQVTLSGGSPTESQSTGLYITYTPNLIYSASLSHSYVQAGTTDTYVFGFKITNNIPRYGSIRLTFPTAWSGVPNGILGMSALNVYGTSKSGFTADTSTSQQVRYANIFDLAGITADSSKAIYITITGISNPTSMMTTGSFQITTLDDAKNPIDQIKTGLTVTISQPGSITINSFNINDKTVDMVTTFQVDFTTSVQYQSGGYIEFVLQDTSYQIFTTPFTCTTVFGLSGAQTCTRVSTTVVDFYRDFVTSNRVSILLSNLKNALGVVTQPYIKMYLKESNGNIVSQNLQAFQYTTTAGTITVSSAVRATTVLQVGLPGASYTLTFTYKTRIAAAGRIQIVFPDEQVAYLSTTTCTDASGTNLGCVWTQGTKSNGMAIMTATIAANPWCTTSITDCAAGGTLTLKLVNAKNPSYINTPLTNSIEIYTQNSIASTWLTVDQITTGIYFTNTLVPGALSSPALVRTGSTLTGGIPIYTFTFGTVTVLPLNAVILIDFPINTAYAGTTIACTKSASPILCTSSLLSTDTSQITQVTISNACTTATCAAPVSFSIVINNMLNPYSTTPVPGVSFTITTMVSSTNGVIDKGIFSATQLALTANTFTTSLTAPVSPIIVGGITSYTIQIQNPNNKVPASTSGGSLVISMPGNVILQNAICSATQSSTTYTCSASTSTQKVTITSSADIAKGSTITVTLSSVKNAPTGATSLPFGINSYVNTYSIDSQLSLTSQADTFNSILTPTSKRNIVTVNSAFTLSITFKTSNPIPKDALIYFYVPTDQAVIDTTISVTDASGSGSVQVITGLTAPTTGSLFNTFTLKEWCTDDNGGSYCPTTFTSKVNINGLKNPPNARFPSESVQIEIYTSASEKIDAIYASLYTIPQCNYGAMQMVDIIRSVQTTGTQTKLTVTFQTAAGTNGDLTSSNGYVDVFMPDGFLYNKNYAISCTIKDFTVATATSTTCTPYYDTNSMGQFLVKIEADLKCGSLYTCSGGKKYVLTVDGFANPFNTASKAGLLISTATIQGPLATYEIKNVLDQTIGTDLSLTQIPAYTTATLTVNSIVRSVTAVDTATTITLDFTIFNRIEKGALIEVQIPISQFVPNGNTMYYQPNGGSSTLLSVTSTTTTHTIVQIKEWCAASALLCPDGTNLKLTITAGFNNVGYVGPTTNYFKITTLTADGLYQVDTTTTNLIATPAVVAATITVSSLTLSSNQVATPSVYADITLKFGARIISSNYILLTFSNEFIRQDSGSIGCQSVSGSTITSLSCTTTNTASVINTVTIYGFCSTTCTASTSYTLRFTNLVNKLYVDAYVGTMLVETRIDSTQLISTITYSVTSVTALTYATLSGITVTRSTDTQGANANFVVTWSSPIYVLDGALAYLDLPLNQVILTQSSTNYGFTDAYSNSISFAQVTGSPTSTYYKYSVVEWLCSSPYCSPGSTFYIKLANSKNPFVQSTTYDNFVIQLKTSTGLMIAQSATPLLATPALAFAKIDVTTITHASSKYVVRDTTYTLLCTVQSDIPQGGFLRITFPPNRVLQGTGSIVCKLGTTTYPCSISYPSTGTQVLISTVCPSANCAGPVTYTIGLSGAMRNPSSIITITGSFTVETLTSAGYIVGRGTMDNSVVSAILPEPFVTYAVTRTNIYMSAQSDLKISFTTVNAVPSTGFFRVILPLDQATAPTNPTCKVDFAYTSLTCRIIFKTSTTVWIDINQSCQGGCSAGQQVSVLLNDITNPSSFSANSVTSTWSVYTMNANKEYIDGIYSGLKATPDLIGKTALIQAMSVDDYVVARNTYLNVGLVAGSQMTNEAIFELYFPDQFAFSRNDNTCYVTVAGRIALNCYFTPYVSGYIYKITIYNACPYQCGSDTTYYYNIPIKNRGDNYYTSSQFKIIAKYEYIDVGMGVLTNPIKFIPDTLTSYDITNRGCDTIDAECNIYLSFKPQNDVPRRGNRGRIRVVLPTQITPQQNICQASFDKNTAGMDCSLNGYTAIATHNQDTIVSQNITIELKRVVNPASTKPTDSFYVYTEVDVLGNGVYYTIDQNLYNITYNVSGLTYLSEAAVSRTPMIDSNGYKTGQSTQLWFQLKLRHGLETTSSFVIQFPEAAQIKIRTDTSSFTCYSTDEYGSIKNLLLCEVVMTNRTVKVRNYCQVATCERRDYVRFMMYDDFIMNYYYVVNPLNATRDSIRINTTTKEGYYYLDTANTSVFVTPQLQATSLIMPSPEILRTNNVINKKSSWVFSFKTNKNPVPQGGYLVIKVPKDVLLTIRDSPIDVLNYETSSLYNNFTYTLYPDKLSVQQIIIGNFCNSTYGCQVGTGYTLSIDWIRNPLSQIKIPDAITFELRTVEGYLAEVGVTPGVNKLFSELIPVKIQNNWIRPINPVPGAVTDYEFIFTADAEFTTSDSMIITFPAEMNPATATSRMLQANISSRCVNIFNSSISLSCFLITNQKVQIQGLFSNNYKHYGVKIKGVQNPSISGPSSIIQIDVVNAAGQGIASRSTNSRVTILATQDQTTCNKVCGSCAGQNSTCTSCKTPSKYPIFREYQCVDTCGSGYYFDRTNLQCVQCHHSCDECFGPGNNQCDSCTIGYFNEDGQCNPYCTKTLTEDLYTRSCVNKNSTKCAKTCATCSLNTNYCLTCDKNSNYPVMDRLTGKCIANDQSLCNNTVSSRFYIDQSDLSCKTCNELCKTCERGPGICSSCQEFQSNNIVNELYETCVDFCGLGTWFNNQTNVCSYCNPVCLMCTGYNATQCEVCNSTPEARQLYKYENQCVLSCPKKYYVNELTNECQAGSAQILSFSFLFMFASVFAAVMVVLVSVILTKCKNHKTIDIVYSMCASVEFVNRFVLLGNLWIKTNVFALAVCFMNLIATCAIAVFFNFLFMSPIYAHSPHFRTLYKKYRLSYQTVTCLSYFVGVNMMRLLCSGFLNILALKSDLNNWKFFVVPLNTMSNFTIIFTVFQLALNVYILMSMSVSDDAFILAILGLLMNAAMMIIQFLKHLNTRTFLIRHS